ncbi:hypothetical protein D3C73_1631660 [compost metagenome]
MNTEGALKKLSADQTSTWYWLLRAMDVAETPALVAQGRASAEGFLLGLAQAQVIDQADCAAPA